MQGSECIRQLEVKCVFWPAQHSFFQTLQPPPDKIHSTPQMLQQTASSFLLYTKSEFQGSASFGPFTSPISLSQCCPTNHTHTHSSSLLRTPVFPLMGVSLRKHHGHFQTTSRNQARWSHPCKSMFSQVSLREHHHHDLTWYTYFLYASNVHVKALTDCDCEPLVSPTKHAVTLLYLQTGKQL